MMFLDGLALIEEIRLIYATMVMNANLLLH
jgi:hypothetical protein